MSFRTLKSDVVKTLKMKNSIKLKRCPKCDRTYAIPDDIKLLAPHVLSHRLIPSGGRKAKTVVEKLLRQVSIP